MMEYWNRHYDDLFRLLKQHFMLTFLSLAIAMAIALPVGYALSKYRRTSIPVMAALGIIYAIPSLGMFALLIPWVGLGMKPAIIALVVYSQLILVRSVISGFQSIDPSIIEAGRGMGMNGRLLFLRIEFPLALPIILGGLRVASVSVIGIATIAAWVNAGGLGVILFEGLYQNSTPKIIWGTIFVALLAILVNQLLLAAEKYALSRARGERSL
ncbi:ABC transporter permease [Cohnella endophytica]|uniref:ABC transporter permease n=1 Tax=Cohnella endophytica TaxID=2419778 RepID=A0A494X584_9BACL|nr:ABC transporter permease [Cohnella endophytica]RKP45865.1 ABC transporter permease [Cohnella endophytica]